MPSGAVTRAADEAQLSEILAQANGDGTACRIAGGSTKQEWGHPGRFDMLLSTTGLHGCTDVDADNLTLSAAAGTTVAEARAQAEAVNRILPLDPGHPGRATIRRSGGHGRSRGPSGRLRRAEGRGAGHPRHPGRRQRRQVRRADHEERHRIRHDQVVRRVLRDPGGDHGGHVPAPPPLRHPSAGRPPALVIGGGQGERRPGPHLVSAALGPRSGVCPHSSSGLRKERRQTSHRARLGCTYDCGGARCWRPSPTAGRVRRAQGGGGPVDTRGEADSRRRRSTDTLGRGRRGAVRTPGRRSGPRRMRATLRCSGCGQASP